MFKGLTYTLTAIAWTALTVAVALGVQVAITLTAARLVLAH